MQNIPFTIRGSSLMVQRAPLVTLTNICSPDMALEFAGSDLLADNGVPQISLADTVGLATPKQVADVVADVMAVHDNIEIGVHLHARPDQAAAKIRAAY